MNKYPIFDGHNDTLLNLHMADRGDGRSFFAESEKGHIDLPRAQAGGLAGGFFAIFVPAKKNKQMGSFPGEKKKKGEAASYKIPLPRPLKQRYALRFTVAVAARLFRLEAESEGRVQVVRTADQLTACLQEGILAAILHFEGAETIDKRLDALHLFYQAGLRSLGLVWSRSNAFAEGVPFNFPGSPDTGPGLTAAGKALVRACNELGILIDLSHLNEKGFWDVAKLSQAPLVATHSNAHALCPSPRNLTDKQLDAIKASNGVVGVNFHIGFLREECRMDEETSYMEIVRHLNYIVERLGIDHVAFGSDFDGARMPQDLKDAAGLPHLIKALQDHGYDDAALKKITHENWERVLRHTWDGNS